MAGALHTLTSFGGHLANEAMHPGRILYDTAFGTLGTMAINAVGLDNGLATVAEMPGLSTQRTNQLGAGLTFGALAAMERATLRTLMGGKGTVY